jgi:sugar phosphate isomerase/epimerase
MSANDTTAIRLGYGTYGMPDEDVFTAIPRLARIGYESVEICALPGRQTEPSRFDASARARLVAVMKDHGLARPVVLANFVPMAIGAERQAMIADFRALMQLTADLAYGSAPPVFTAVLGGILPAWDVGRVEILDNVVQFGRIAAEHGVVLAVEPHVGGSLDHPDKARWLVDTAASASVRLNFDVSHFVAQRLDIPAAIATCLPRAAHIHVKDVIHTEQGFEFALPGKSTFDYADYFSRVSAAGSAVPVVVEVSAQVWRKEGYEPWPAAEETFRFLDGERRRSRGLHRALEGANGGR